MSSYCTVAQGNTLAEDRFPSYAWDSASERDKSKALGRATTLISNLRFNNAFDATANAVVAACFELAYELLDGADPQKELDSAFQSVSAFDALRVGKLDVIHPRILHGIVSHQAWTYLRPYLIDPNTIKLSRI